MKKTLLTLALTAVVASTGMAQGFVLFSNSGSEKISVNAIMGGPATGAMPTTSTYYFALFYSATATTVDGSAAAVTGAGNYVLMMPIGRLIILRLDRLMDMSMVLAMDKM